MSRCLSWKSFIPLSLLVSLLSSNALGGSDPTFNFAVFGGKSVSLSGGSYTDSYVGTASRVTKGEYKNGAVGTNSLQSCSISLSGNGTRIYGKALVGAGGNPATEICTNGGSQIYNNDSGTLPVAKAMTPPVDPGGGTSFGALHLTAGTQKTLSAGNYRYGSIALSGGAALTLSGEITLHVDGNLTLSGGSKIIVAGGPVTIYANGQKIDISGGSVINSTQDPKMLIIYGGASLATVNLSGGVTQHFWVYAPNAAITLSGGQSTFGSIIGNTITMSGGSSVHFPENTDSDPPVITIASPLPGALLNIPATTVSGSVNEAVSSVTVNGKGAAVNGTGFTFTGLQLTEGVNTIEIQATDPAGNIGSASITVTLDSVPPAAPVIAQPKTPTNVASVAVGGAAEPHSEVRVYAAGALVGTAAADSLGNFNLPNVTLAEGPNTLTAAAVDTASNLGPASKPVTVILDTVPPSLTVSALSDGSYTNNQVMNIAGTATDSGGIKDLLVNGSPIPVAADGSYSYAMTLGTGANRVELKATDMAGNGTVDVRSINLDQKAPRLTVDSPADNSKTGNAPQKVSGSVDETSTVEVRLNGATQPVTMNGTAFTSETRLIPGINTIEVLATDLAGNKSSEKRTVVYDDQTPAVSISDPDRDIMTNKGSIVLRGTASDPYTVVSVTIDIDGQSFTPPVVDNRFEQTVAFTAEKSYPITVTAVNEVKRSSAAVRNVIYDITPPIVTINAPTSPTNQANQFLSGTMESGATVTVACATAAVGEVTYPTATSWRAQVSGFSADANEITVTAADLAGNTATVAAKIAYDVTAPTGTIAVDGGATVTGASQAELALTSSDSSGVVLMKLSSDGLTWTDPLVPAAKLPWDLGSGDGTKQVFVSFMDQAGNWSAPIASLITLDTTPPVITVGSPSAGSFVNTPGITVSGTVNETVGSVTVNGTAAAVAGFSWSAPFSLAEGLNMLTIQAVDPAGNSATATAAVTLDTVAPTITITFPPQGLLTGRAQLTATGTVSEEFTTVTVNNVAATVTGKSWSAPVTLSEGVNILSVQATDRAGNSGSATVAVTLDATPPAAPVLAPLRTPTNIAAVAITGNAEPLATVKVFAAGTLVGTVSAAPDGSFTLPGITLADGTNTFTATAGDAAGNESAPSSPVTVLLDTKPPVITLSSPSDRSYTNQASIPLKGSLDDATATLSVNGAPVRVASEGAFEFPVTLTPGQNSFVLTALDPAGNAATTTVTVTLDTVAPAVTISSPVPGLVTKTAQITVAGTVSKADTAVTLNGAPLAVTNKAFSTPYTLSEGENTLSVQATDRAGNTGTAAVTVTLDTQPPVVGLTAPASAAAGANVQIDVTGSDNRGLTLVEVLAGGDPLWTSTLASASLGDGFVYHVPPDAATGSTIQLQAKGYDAAGNQGTATASINVTIGASGPGFIQGKVLDDSRGLLLSGASASATDASGTPQSVTTGDDGGFFFQLSAGNAVVQVGRDGYTTVERPVSVLSQQRASLFDARLTAVSPATVIGSAGGTIKAPLSGGLQLELSVPAGALPADTEIRLTPVSNQGLQGLLPTGWSPLAVADLRLTVPGGNVPAGAPTSPAILRAPVPGGLAAAPAATLVRYDATSHRWIAKVDAVLSADGSSLSAQISDTGEYALVTADPAPNAPAPAVAGEPLSAATSTAAQFDLFDTAGRVVPQAAPPSAGLRAAGEVILTAKPDVQPVPLFTSGLILTANITQKFDLYSGAPVQPADYSQDILLFRTPCVTNISAGVAGDAASPQNLRTTFPVSPSRDFTIVDLMLGKVGVSIVPPETSAGIMVGTDGARLLDGDGNILQVPAGALGQTVPVTTRTIVPSTASGFIGADFTLLKGVDVDFTKQLLSRTAVLSIPAPAGLDPSLPVVVAKRIDVKGAPKLKLVALAKVSGSLVISDATLPSPLVAPGITGSGSYFFLQAKRPVGFLSGTVTDASGAPFAGSLVSTDGGSLVDLSAASGSYLTAVPVGSFTATALDLYKGDQGSGAGTIGGPNQATVVDLVIRMIPPQVGTISPAANAVNVQPSVPVVVTFTKPMDRSTVTSSTLTLSEAGGAVTGVISFNPDGTVVTFYPSAALKSETSYTLTVAGGIKDLQGYPLGQDVVSRFTVRKTTPPPMPAAGSVTGTFPDADGFITVTATQGSAEPGNTVLLINDTTGEIVSVTPASNGGFTGRIRAQLGDQIQVVLMDYSGNRTLISYITYRSDDGKYLVTAKGGKVEGEGGSLLTIPDGALVGPTEIKVMPVAQESLPHPVPNGGKFLGAVNLNSGGFNFQKPVEVSIRVPANMPDGAVPFLAQPQDLVNPDGTVEKVYVIIDSAKVVGNRLTTACPPFDGVMGFGIFVFLYVDGVVGEDVTVAGYAYRDMDGLPGYTLGADQPIKGAIIRAPGAQNFVSYTNSTGHYATYGFTVPGACRNFPLMAIHPQTMNRVSANVMTCDAPYIVNNFNFRLADKDTQLPDSTPPVIDATFKEAPGQPVENRIIAGVVPVGTEVELPISVVDQAIDSITLSMQFQAPEAQNASPLTIQASQSMSPRELAVPQQGERPALWRTFYTTTFTDPAVAASQPLRFKTSLPGNYTVTIIAKDLANNRATKVIQVRAAPKEEMQTLLPVEGPPTVDDISPANGTTDVMVTTTVEVTFSEPVENVTGDTFKLIDYSATVAPGVTTTIYVPASVTTKIVNGRMQAVLTPLGNLYYGRQYQALLTSDIRDKGGNATAPAGGDGKLNLQEVRVTFTTKKPSAYDLDQADQFAGGRDVDIYTFNDTASSQEKTYIYAAAGESGYRVIDVTDPTVPKVLYSKNMTNAGTNWSYRNLAVHPDSARGLLAMTDSETFADGSQFGYVRFYSLKENPVNPPVVGREKLAEAYSGIPGRVAWNDKYVYVATASAALQVVDSDLAIQRQKDGLATDGSSIVGIFDSIDQGFGSPNDIAVLSNTTAVLTTNSGYFLTLDLTIPNMPAQLATLGVGDGRHFTRVATAAEFPYTDENGQTQTIDLAVAGTREGKIHTVNLTTPSNPQVIGTAVTDVGSEATAYVMDISVSKEAGLAFVTTFNSIQVYDIKNPFRPRLLNEINQTADSSGTVDQNGLPVMVPVGATPAIIEKGGWVYMANQQEGLRVMDLDPAGLTLSTSSLLMASPPISGVESDVSLTYTVGVLPTFKPFSAVMYVYENGREIWRKENIPYSGTNTLAFPSKSNNWRFDASRRYEAQIVLNGRYQIPLPVIGAIPIPYDSSMQKKVRIPMEWQAIATDYNRDGKIDADDFTIAKAKRPYYFWINDNDDVGETGGSGIPGSGDNWRSATVNGTRDLVDYFPVYLEIASLLSILPPNQYNYVLKQYDSAISFVPTSLQYNEAKKYLTDVATAHEIGGTETLVGGYSKYVVYRSGSTINTRVLPVQPQNNSKLILVEGRAQTRQPLILEIQERDGKNVAFRSELQLSLDGVEEMFRHKNLTHEMYFVENPPEHYIPPTGIIPIAGHPVPFDGASDRLTSGDFKNPQRFTALDATNEDKDFIHVHGYNVNGRDARGEHAEVFKRLYWSGSKARFWGVTWFGYDSQDDASAVLLRPFISKRSGNYHVNVRHAFNAGKLLKYFVLSQPKLATGNATISAHSLGNMVASTAIQNGMPYFRYIMANPAVAEEAYMPESEYRADVLADQTKYPGKSLWDVNSRRLMYHPAWTSPEMYKPSLWASEWYKLFDSTDGRSRLTWRNYFSKVRDDQKAFVFFTPTDEAFRPFNYDATAPNVPQAIDNYPPNLNDIPGFEDVVENAISGFISYDSSRIGTYSWAIQELFKGRVTLLQDESYQSGWGFNKQDGYYISCIDPVGDCGQIRPVEANHLSEIVLKSKPLFKKDSDNMFLYTDAPLNLTDAKVEELLANEIPALTFAAGHRGVKAIKNERNIDVRNRYLINTNSPWVLRETAGRQDYIWKHSDFVNVAYPYSYLLFNDWVSVSMGSELQ